MEEKRRPKVWQVPKPTSNEPKTVTLVCLKFYPAAQRPYILQLWKGKRIAEVKDFITKTAALDYVQLNHPKAEFKDWSDSTGVRRCES